MQIRRGITPKYLLEALKTGGSFGSYRGSNVANRAGLIKAQPKVYEAAQKKVRDLLQGYVDEWLDTAFKNGVEEPAKRKLLDTEKAVAAVQGYVQRYPPQVFPADEGLFAIFLSARVAVGATWSESEGRMVPTIDDPLADAAEEAARIFTLLIDAPWRDRVYKCRRCDRYGVLPRRPIPMYKRGVHCAGCSNDASADASNKGKRGKQHDKRIELAADAWREWKPKNGVRNKWVAQRVNGQLGYSDRITGYWVTFHLKEIESRSKVK